MKKNILAIAGVILGLVLVTHQNNLVADDAARDAAARDAADRDAADRADARARAARAALAADARADARARAALAADARAAALAGAETGEVHILNQSGKNLVIIRDKEIISPKKQSAFYAIKGDTIQLKDSPSDFIKIDSIGRGGDEKGGRLMSVCDFIKGRSGKCAIHFVE